MSRRKMTKEKAPRNHIDEERFIKAWARVHKDDGNLQDVADEVGCTYAGAKNKAEKLVEAGVKLPELRHGRGARKRDVAALNATLKAELAKK